MTGIKSMLRQYGVVRVEDGAERPSCDKGMRLRRFNDLTEDCNI